MAGTHILIERRKKKKHMKMQKERLNIARYAKLGLMFSKKLVASLITM